MSRPLIGNRNSWVDFEKCILEVFILALEILRNKNTLPVYEDSVQSRDSLNRRLDICLRDAILEWERINETDILTTPKSNLGKQPDLDNEEIVNDYERTKPDFQWEFRDRLGNGNSRNSIFRNYEVECKRLGANLSSGRSLTKEYVSEGILRFTISTHRYGQFAYSGLMIGYVQDTELQTVLNEVNRATQSAFLPELLLSSVGWKLDVNRLDHRLNRLNVEPTPFDLRHLWVDLHHHYNQQPVVPKKKASGQKKRTTKKPNLSSTSQ